MWFQKQTSKAELGEGSGETRTERRGRRYEPKVIYEFAETLRRRGVDLAKRSGPWQPVKRMLWRPGRNGMQFLPIVTNGFAQIMVDTMEHATDLAGLLNFCGVDDLDPVPDLVPPPGLRYQGAMAS